jgi:superoxide dismutase
MKRKVIKNLNTIIEETRSQKRKNKRRSKEMDRIAKATNQAKKKVMVHTKMLPGLKKSNKRKRNSSKMTKENSLKLRLLTLMLRVMMIYNNLAQRNRRSPKSRRKRN